MAGEFVELPISQPLASLTIGLTDGLGSTAQLAEGTGAVTGAYTYDAFGSVRTHTGASTEWTFTGEQNDPTAWNTCARGTMTRRLGGS